MKDLLSNTGILKKAVAVLKTGGIIAHATETCYGFACDALNKNALKKLYALKQMKGDKPVSILVHSLEAAKKFGVFNKNSTQLAKKYWPGPLTIVIKRKKSLPPFLNSKSKTVGIRVPDHKLSLLLAKKFGGPITTTSANISGENSPYSVGEIERQFENQKIKPDFVIDGGLLKKNLPSTIVDYTSHEMKIIRQGDLKIGG